MSELRQLSLFDNLLTASKRLPLVDPPYSLRDFKSKSYSSSRNAELEEFVEQHQASKRDSGVSQPLPEDLVAGKNTYAYDAHTYHTKVPPQAIERLIEHYTEEGDIVLDPFCGSGMTGVAALRTHRNAILIDLSPAATFIAANFMSPINGEDYKVSYEQILTSLDDEELRLYGTHCRKCDKLVPMNYMVWSYGLLCNKCNHEFILWDVARDEHKDVRKSKILKEFGCPHCGQLLKKRHLKRTIPYPVQVGYQCCGSGRQESTATPDEYDLELLEAIENEGIPEKFWYPGRKLPNGKNTRQPITQGLKTVDSLYTTRQLYSVSHLWDIARRWKSEQTAFKLMFTVTSLYQRVTRLSEFRFWGGSGNIANYNVPMIFNEQNVFQVFERKAKTIKYYLDSWATKPEPVYCISTQSATCLESIPDNSIDYVFTDPPFGQNINYSEMNFLWEAWLDAFTEVENEAIVNNIQGKSLNDYQQLLTQAFKEIHRVLKPDKWLTVMFHNSSAKVWTAIQAALADSDFTVQATQTLDKKHDTFKQFVSPNAVGYDLLMHCHKTTNHLNNRIFISESASENEVEKFITVELKRNLEDYVVRYLHVDRKNEIDGRKLYSLWLKRLLESGRTIEIDYEEFRDSLFGIISKDPSLNSSVNGELL
jgi:DNA modification methylase